jgi:hypothetical protein
MTAYCPVEHYKITKRYKRSLSNDSKDQNPGEKKAKFITPLGQFKKSWSFFSL